MSGSNTILEIKNLTVTLGGKKVLDDVSFSLFSGEVTSLVGESGSGKTMTALAILGLLPYGAVREHGEILFIGKNLFNIKKETLRNIRGNRIAMVFQEPFTALNPVMRVGIQIDETILAHMKITSREAARRREELLNTVKLPPEISSNYPHELSGGMRQRVMMAIALACDPDVLILDEPTTALDVSVQKHILDLIKQIQDIRRMAVLFITHDFSIVNLIADKVCVMRGGIIVEKGTKGKVLKRPDSEYTRQLVACIPRLGDKRDRLPVLERTRVKR